MDKRKTATEQNLEDAEVSLEALRSEQQKKAVPWWKRVLNAIGRPFVSLFRALKRISVPITVKTTVVYTLLFAVALSLTVIFMIVSVKKHMQTTAAMDDGYLATLIITGVLLVVIDIVVVAALGSLAANAMMSPVRKMIKKIDKISADDLSARLDPVDGTVELRELTDRINAMLDNIEQSFSRQKKFVSDASHELKTPIAVIQGYSNLLKRWGKADAEVLDEGIDSIAREAENMQRIVEQLLFLAKLGRFVLSPEDVELKGELSGIAEGYALLWPSREIRFSAKRTAVCTLDKNMLTECVRAIVDNAVKYSPDGTAVEISLKAKDGMALIAVSDSGVGISEEDLPHIFDRFYRCDKSRKRDNNGSGLGLTIAASIVEMLGGKIEVKSKLGVGSTFTLSFPLKEKDNE